MNHWWIQPVINSTLGWSLCAIMGICVLIGVWYRPARVQAMRWWLIHTPAIIAIITLLLILLNPLHVSTHGSSSTQTPTYNLAVLIDTSPSMKVADDSEQQSRLVVATNAASELAALTDNTIGLQYYTFADNLNPIDFLSLPENTLGQTTRLYSALHQLLTTDYPLQNILLISDGIDHPQANSEPGLNDIIRLAHTRGVNIHTMAIGSDQGPNSVRIDPDQSQITARLGQRLKLQGRMHTHGLVDQKLRATLHLKHHIIAQQTITVESHPTQTWSWDVLLDQPGLHLYQMHLEEWPLPSQHVQATAAMLVRVHDEPVKVLILEGQPNRNYHSIMRLLQSQPQLEVTSLLRLDQHRWLYRYIPAHTKSQYDSSDSKTSSILMTQRWSMLDHANAQQLFADMVESETEVVLIGRQVESLFNGKLSDQLWQVVRQRSVGLMSYSKNTDNTTGIITDDTRHPPVLNTIHQLALQHEQAEAQVRLRSPKLSYASDEPIILELLSKLADATGGSSVRVRSMDDSAKPDIIIKPGDTSATYLSSLFLKPMTPGIYQAVVQAHDDNVDAQAVFEVLNTPLELIDIRPRSSELRWLSHRTNGLVLSPGQLEPLVDVLQQQYIRHLRSSADVTTLRDRWWMLLIILSMFSLTWWLRRREGLA